MTTFDSNDDRQMLVDTLARYLGDRYPFETRNRIAGTEPGWSREHWRALAELGIVGALFDEASGGFGGSGLDIGAVFEQLGRALVVEPFLPTLMAGRALAKAGGQDALLAAMLAGETLVAFAHEEPQSRYEIDAIEARATRAGNGWTITGAKAVVAHVEAADRILVSARDGDGIALFLVENNVAGIDVRGYPLIDGGRAGELTLDATPATLVATDGRAILADAIAAGTVALCWEAVGAMDTVKAATLDYLRTRQQFGVPIGKFQALQHRMATVALEIEQARSAAINAALALDEPPLVRDRAAAAGKYTIGHVGALVAEEAVQLHGGIGMTWELPLSHYAKRLVMIDHQLGDEDFQLERYIVLGR